MLRNLRNMIKAGISEKHHTWVLKKLTDEGAVVNSRQFPFRFFSAYEVLKGLEKEYKETRKCMAGMFTYCNRCNKFRISIAHCTFRLTYQTVRISYLMILAFTIQCLAG